MPTQSTLEMLDANNPVVTTARLRDIALPLINRGIPVVPAQPGQSFSRLPDWQNIATTDAAHIAEWDEQYHGWNLVCVAKPDQVVIVDVDDLEAAKAMGLPDLPDTFTSQTPRPGYHTYYSPTDRSRALGNRDVKGASGAVLELKVCNKSVCAPGCVRNDDKYQNKSYSILKNLPLAPFPDALADWIDTRSPKKQEKGDGPPVDEAFDFDDFCEHYEIEIVHVNGAWHSPRVCPVKGAAHTAITDCAFYWDGETLGWKDHASSCEGADMSIGQLVKFMNQQQEEPYPGRIWPEREGFEADWADDSEALLGEQCEVETGNLDGSLALGGKSCAQIKSEIDGIMRLPGSPVKDGDWLPMREKSRKICGLILAHLKANGKFYNCGNVATYVDDKARSLIEVVRGGQKFQRLLIRYGVYPGDKLCDDIGKFLGSCAINAPANTIRMMSFYDCQRHLVYVNEYGGNFLRINGKGHVDRLRNGDDDMLFTDGKAGQCSPLQADLELVNLDLDAEGPVDTRVFEAIINNRGLLPSGLIQQQILETINYPEHGVGKDNAQIILMTALLALFFHERIRSNPFIYLYGPGASMKSSLALKVGKLLQGPKFAVTPATDDVDELKIMAMNNPFLVLDEANSIKKLTDALKSIATGALDKRRELYTTANERVTPYQSRIWMTANTASLTNETISSRMMIIDAGPRTEDEPYRSEHYLEMTDQQRNSLWTELVSRLAMVMQQLADADRKGEGDLAVSHRMSSFFVFGRTLARQGDWEEKFLEAMKAMEARQTGASAEGNDIVYLIQKLPASYNRSNGKGYRTAEEWAEILPGVVPEANRELKQTCARPGWVRHQFTANRHVLQSQCGMKVQTVLTPNKNRINAYSFSKCAGPVEEIPHDGCAVVDPCTG